MSNIQEIKSSILDQTNGGIDVFEHYLPIPSNRKKKFKIREEKTPSASIKEIAGVWILTDFGSGEKSMNCFDFVMNRDNSSFIQACRTITQDLCLMVDFGEKPVEYAKPKVETGVFSEYQKEILDTRGLDWVSIMSMGVTTSKRFFPSANAELECFAIPFYSGGELVNYKYIAYHEGKKHISNTKDAQRTFWGIDSIKDNPNAPVIITEGEWDAMSVIQACKKHDCTFNVVSVPNGVNSLQTAFKCLEKIQACKEVYIFVDADKQGGGR